MNIKKMFLTSLSLVLTIAFLSSCSLPRRKSLEITPFSQNLLVKNPRKIIVQFEESIPGKPLKETVWDNVSGPFWDVKESEQIGFTQNYKPQFFAVPPVLLPAAAQSGMDLFNTRIVIPFGNIFSNVFESALQKNFPEYSVCFNDTCVSEMVSQDILKIKIDKFFVWEAPLNHLNLYAKGKSTYIENRDIKKNYEFEKSLLSQKLGSFFSTHSKFIKEMNRLSNQLAGDLTVEIIVNTLE